MNRSGRTRQVTLPEINVCSVLIVSINIAFSQKALKLCLDTGSIM